jgi:hypothetical protein
MKPNSKGKFRMYTDHELKKRFNYLKSKLSPNVDDISNEMKYIKYHLRSRGIKI